LLERKCRAEEVERDPVTKKVIWVRIQYFKNDKLFHDVRFVPIIKDKKLWVTVAEKITGDFIPWNRYEKMRNMALAIVRDKKKKPPKQLQLPFEPPN